MNIPYRNLRQIAIAEGISFIAFAVTMPLKYGLEIYWPNKIVGWMHGLLFMLYWALMILAAFHYRWSWKQSLIILLSSMIPFAPFWVDRRYLKDPESYDAA